MNFSSPFRLSSRLAGVFLIFTVLAGCSKEYSFEKSLIPTTYGTWEFTESGTLYQGDIDSAQIDASVSPHELHLIGHSKKGTGKFHMILFGDEFTPGTYKASAYHSAFDYGDNFPFTYSTDQSAGEFEVTILTVNQNVITATFGGTVVKSSGESAEITNGSLKASLKKPAPPSEGVLGNESGNCSPVQVNGSYRQGTPLNASNSIQIELVVNTPGSYLIYTDPVNGVVFKASGEFTRRGKQTVILTGEGIPAFGGDQNFTIHYGNSMCAFTLGFAETAGATNDYFPTSQGSQWEYSNGAQRMFYKVTNRQGTFNGNKYIVIGQFAAIDDTQYDTIIRIRKDAGNYYDVIDYAEFTGDAQPEYHETTFLKDNLSKGATWDDPEVSVTANGITTKLKLHYTILDKDVPVTMGPFNLPAVIKVKVELYLNNIASGLTAEYWYGRNVGLVYSRGFDGRQLNLEAYQIL